MTAKVLKRSLLSLAALAFAALSAPAAAQDAAGDWLGVIEPAPGTRLPLVVHIARDDAGAFTGTMDSPLQATHGLPLTEISVEAGSLAFTAPTIGGAYRGQWDEAAKTWKGEWSQAGQSWPLSFGVPPAPTPLPADWRPPSNEAIAALIAERNAPRAGQGIVVGVLSPEGRRIVAGGPTQGAPFDGDVLFEIGSITKIFTALILADMVNKGEVSLDDPAAKYLPRGHRMPTRNGREITLLDLATHRSGLPRMAPDMGAIDHPDGPFADYSEQRLLSFLDSYELPRDIGSQWEYSNLGVGLLGYLLARASGDDYETLLRERITRPLGMRDTMIALRRSHRTRLAPPFDAYMRAAKPWDLSALAGAGAIRSSANDMLTFAAAVLDPNSPIARAVTTTLSVRVPGGAPSVEQALGWQVAHPEPGRELLLHDGQTGGYRAMLALEPAKQTAVVALANSAAEPSTVDLSLHILMGSPTQPTPPVTPAPTPRVGITLSPTELDKVVGHYDFGSGVVVAVTRDGATLRAHRADIPGAPALQIFPEGPLAFFWKATDAQIRFTTDANGAVTGAELVAGGQTLTGARIER